MSTERRGSTTQDPTLAQCKALAKRFPWARRDCPCVVGHVHPVGRRCPTCIAESDRCYTQVHSTTCDCAGFGYLPLGENNMLAAVLRECQGLGWEVRFLVSREVCLWEKQIRSPSLFAAFLAATEGEQA